MINDIKDVIANKEQIENICSKLGKKIEMDYQDKFPIFIGLLKGCQPFMSDLLKSINCYCEIEYMKVSSYAGTKTTGKLNIKVDTNVDVKDRNIIIIDDIVDSGITASNVIQLFIDRGAKSVEFCALLDKPEGRLTDITVKYVGMNVPNEFVVGYGLDYNEKYRNLPFIGILKEEIYK